MLLTIYNQVLLLLSSSDGTWRGAGGARSGGAPRTDCSVLTYQLSLAAFRAITSRNTRPVDAFREKRRRKTPRDEISRISNRNFRLEHRSIVGLLETYISIPHSTHFPAKLLDFRLRRKCTPSPVFTNRSGPFDRHSARGNPRNGVRKFRAATSTGTFPKWPFLSNEELSRF